MSSMHIEKADLYRSQLIQGNHDRVQGPKADCLCCFVPKNFEGKEPLGAHSSGPSLTVHWVSPLFLFF